METVSKYTAGLIKTIGTRENQSYISKNLYKVMREFDYENLDCI